MHQIFARMLAIFSCTFLIKIMRDTKELLTSYVFYVAILLLINNKDFIVFFIHINWYQTHVYTNNSNRRQNLFRQNNIIIIIFLYTENMYTSVQPSSSRKTIARNTLLQRDAYLYNFRCSCEMRAVTNHQLIKLFTFLLILYRCIGTQHFLFQSPLSSPQIMIFYMFLRKPLFFFRRLQLYLSYYMFARRQVLKKVHKSNADNEVCTMLIFVLFFITSSSSVSH